MHLKRLEAFGFKSFADKIVFDFERGVTCFVGPNGCGKSNVVDAVKWVLGEQSAKSLRGGEMLDVIFNGSGGRKALNFAEVTLIFDNADGMLPLGAPEVAVSRRLFRTGESEYLINKALCRLRDVRELFWDTGIGTSSYSVIEQGRISALLEASSKDRRILFEEAAGIHKYKERKRIALRKLERVEQNLARLGDIRAEVERNLKTVTRQAEKARKAKEISDRLRQTRIDILLNDAFTSQESLREVTAGLTVAQERVAKLDTELTEAQTQTAAQQTLMSDLDARLGAAQQQLSDARGRLQRLEAELESGQRSIAELNTQADAARAASTAADERANVLAQECKQAALDVISAGETFKAHSTKAEELAAAAEQEQAAREALLKELEAARRYAIDALGRRSQLQDALVRAEAELGSLEYRVRRSQAQAMKADDQLRFAQAESSQARERMAELQQRREALETEQLNLRALQQQNAEEAARVTRASQELQRELESRRSRLTALEGLRESGEGLSQGARAVLTAIRHELNLAADVHGLAADCLGVDPRLEQAIEAALGNHLETIVVTSVATAKTLAARLSRQELGRATFLPLESVVMPLAEPPTSAAKPVAPDTAPGLLGCAADLVSFDERYRAVAQALLGHVLVFDTEQNAADACTSDGTLAKRWTRVSLSGELFDRNGSFSGGRYKPQRLGLIGRKNEIARIREQMEELGVKTQEIAERAAALEARANELAGADEKLNAELNALKISHTEVRSMLAAIEREESRSTEEKNLAVKEIGELEAERAAQIERVAGLRSELEISQRAESESAAAARQLETALTERDQALNATRALLAEAQREAATWRERVTALEREGLSLTAQHTEWRKEAGREAQRAEALDERARQAAAELEEKRRFLGEQSQLIDGLGVQFTAAQQEKEECRMAFDRLRGREREIASEQQRAREELAGVREKEVNLRVRLEGKLEQAHAEFQIDAQAELQARGGPPEIPAEALMMVRELEEKLARLGPVNMYALEELDELEKRHGFLKIQFEDLDSARASLRDVIARINRRSRTLFQETFEAVKSHFNEIFRKLFGGGKADLLLEEGEDILEAGIEIIARPPGKELRSVSLLSGGEKTMTMIALLFAVFRSRPAPFCILDEVDAPLDEANVERFNTIVREFMDRSQFVVITHNKKTMSYADILYGITMPEAGVSKRIAIKFEEIERHLPMEEIERQAEEARALGAKMELRASPEPTELAAEPNPAAVETANPMEAALSAGE